MTTSVHEKERLFKQYDAGGWIEKTQIGKKVFIHKFFMAGNEIPGWRLIKAIPEQFQNGKRILTYMWQKAEEKPSEEVLIKMDIIESMSWRGAHDALLELLGEFQVIKLSDASSRKMEIGDVGFIGFGGIIESTIFVRANMLACIRSVGRVSAGVTDVAVLIDRLFFSKPKISESGVIPNIEMFSSERMTLKPGEKVFLNIMAKEPLERRLWYKFIIDEGEIFIEDKKVWFSSTMPGKPEISLFVINENGFVSGASLQIRIEG